MMHGTSHSAGRTAELVAAWLLRLKGFRIMARRYATPLGEIDLIAKRGRLLLFVEVKRRADLAAATEAALPRQRARIVRAAELFLQRRPDLAGHCRFDLIAVAPWRWPVHVRDAWRP
ncbi:MAG TPA: YraN family protein [Geminicoccaceae bacterium]|nr:YraN family protein [Geminicoccaceae bacterium]